MKTSQFSKRKRSQLSEKKLALSLGGKVQPASGALPVKSFKGDVKTDLFLLDDKTTLSKSFGVKLEDWRKLRKQAWLNKRTPAISIYFEREGVRLFVISDEAFKNFICR